MIAAPFIKTSKDKKIKMMTTTIAHTPIFPRLAALSLAGKAIAPAAPRRRSPTLSRRELARLIADMVD